MAEGGGRFTEDEILSPVAAPPAGAVRMPGAKLVRIYGEDPPRKGDGGREGVILAWAPIPRRGLPPQWAVLLAWTGYYRLADGHATHGARVGWYRLEPRVRPVKPLLGDGALPGQLWHGWFADSQLQVAIDAAARLLPEEMRDAAVTPAERQGP